MRVRSDLPAVEAVLEEVADAAMPAICAAGVIPVDLLEPAGDRAFRSPQDDVVVVRHQTPGEDLEAVFRRSRRQLLLQAGIVRAIERDQATVVASRRHVVDLVRIEDAQLAAHAKTVER